MVSKKIRFSRRRILRGGGLNFNDAKWGYYSLAGGGNSLAAGNYGIAFGAGAIAGKDYSVNFGGGFRSGAGCANCIVMGEGSSAAYQPDAIALGWYASAMGPSSIAMGYFGASPAAVAPYSIAIGDSIRVSGTAANSAGIALGYKTMYPLPTGFTVTAPGVIAIPGGKIGIGVTNPTTTLAIGNLQLVSWNPNNYKYLVANTSTDTVVSTFGSASCSSSRKYKKDIKPLKDDFYGILKVEPKSFVFKSNNEPDIGVIAEEVNDWGIKNLVMYSKEGEPDGFQYEKVSLYLLMIMKDHEKKIKQLKAIVCQDHPRAEFCK